MTSDFLDWTADPPRTSAAPHLRAFRSLVLAHVAVQAWGWAITPIAFPYTFPPAAIYGCAVALTGLCALSLFRFGREACAGAAALVAWELFWIFPLTPNHCFLSLVLLFLCAFLDPNREGEDALLLQGLRWVAVIVFVWAGLQKALHGLYFRGEFLTWAIAHGGPRWSDLFGLVVPADELARVRALPAAGIGAGPYRIASLPFVVLANAVWLGEIALGVGMLLRRTRELAALGAIGLVFAIQSAPREFMFALLYTNLLLLFVRGEPNRRLLVGFLLVYAWLVAALLGAPGAWLLSPEGGL